MSPDRSSWGSRNCQQPDHKFAAFAKLTWLLAHPVLWMPRPTTLAKVASDGILLRPSTLTTHEPGFVTAKIAPPRFKQGVRLLRAQPVPLTSACFPDGPVL